MSFKIDLKLVRDILTDEREILVWYHRLDHCYFKYLLRLHNRGKITMKINRIRKLPPCVAFMFGKPPNRPWRTNGKQPGGSTRKTSDTSPGAMTSIDQMVSAQPGLITQVTGDLTHARFWSATVFVDHYSDYFYANLITGTSSEETLWAEEAYKNLESNHGYRICAYREDNWMF